MSLFISKYLGDINIINTTADINLVYYLKSLSKEKNNRIIE